MNFIRTIFGSVSNRYLIRAYVFSLALFIYAVWYFLNDAELQGYQKFVMIGYAALSAVLFPFAKLVWDEIRDTIMGDNSIVHFGWWAIGVHYMFKLFVNIILWFAAIIVAPLGILYLWYKNRGFNEPS